MDKHQLNYYKNVEKYAKSKTILFKNKEDFDEDPLDLFLKINKKIINSYKRKKIDIVKKNGIYTFQNLILHIGIRASSEIFDEKRSTLKSYAYGYRIPTSEHVKKFIKITNGALIFESFYGDINDFSRKNK